MNEFLEAFSAAHADTMALQSRRNGRHGGVAPWAGVAATALVVAGLAIGGLVLMRDEGSDPVAASSSTNTVATRAQEPDAALTPSFSAPEALSQAHRLVKHAFSAQSPAERRNAVQHLATVRPEAGRDHLISALGDDDSLVRRVAATALGQMGVRDAKTLIALRTALPRQMGFSAIAVAKALVSLGDRRAVGRLKRERALARRRGPRAEQYALEALVGIDPKAAGELAIQARSIEWADNPQAKARLLLVLAQAGDAAARATLHNATVQHHEAARVHAAVAYAQIDRKAGGRALRALTKVGPTALQATVRGALVQLGDAKSVENLLELLSSADSETAVVSALSLGQAQGQQRLPATVAARVRVVLSRALQRRDGDVRLAAAVALLTYT